ncbi:Structural maintenance of chromosomes protein 3 [Phlyctochytrium bullatum]|nr:Structural maintenance of chromosomes protein 3 [Phlyctochytrium bullatum]
MTREERQSLLHEGTGQATISAYVEIIFDNSDNRFPTGKDEVVLRRTIGLKKDEYSLDKKIVNKVDVMNLLESAGFSKSNPYYIVPQGRITALTNAKDAERLQLLKEVAGTKVYENRRQESLKIMDETETKRQKINELLGYINERLNELEEEKEELRQFQDLDRQRRTLEYTILYREQTEVNRSLEELEEQRRYEIEGNAARQIEFNSRDRVIADLEQEIQELRQTLEGLRTERVAIDESRQELVRDSATLEMQVKDMEEQAKRSTEDHRRLVSEKKKLDKTIAEREKQLHSVSPKYEEAVRKENDLKEKVQCTQAEHQALLDKQGRSKQFTSKKERDEYLKNELSSLQSAFDETTQQKELAAADLEAVRTKKARLEKEVEEKKSGISARDEMVRGLVEEIEAVRLERNRMDERRKELWREEHKSSAMLEQIRDDLARAERSLMSSIDRNVSSAIQGIKAIAARRRLKGVYGPLYELFTVDERYRSAVEVIGGGSLFHIVVDTDETASILLEELNRERLGRITFMPLNRLHPKEIKYPNANDAIPMIRKLKYDQVLHPAFLQVFGKAIVCPTLEIASHYARQDGINAVTLDGDRADKKGSLTGGFLDQRRSKLEAARLVRVNRTKFDEESEKVERLKEDAARVDQQILGVRDRIASLEKQKEQAVGSLEPMRLEVRQMKSELAGLGEAVGRKEQSCVNLERNLKVLGSQIEATQKELESPFAKTLSNAEIARLKEIVPELEDLSTRLNAASSERAKFESTKSILESELGSNLRRQREALEAKLVAAERGLGAASVGVGVGEGADSQAADPAVLERRKRELKEFQQRLAASTQRLQDLEVEIEDTESNIGDRHSALEKAKAEQAEEARAMERQQRHLEKYVQRKSLLQRKKEETTRGIRDLGLLPEEALREDAEMTGSTSSELLARLHRVNDGLKKFAHVNKKAFEQYASFTKQKDGLEKRRKELDSSAKSIEDLIQVLDQRKDEAIERTFKQVAKHFRDVWRKLVPSGYGKLVMMRRAERGVESNSIEQRNDDGDAEEEQQQLSLSQSASQMDRLRTSIDRFDGVGISVSFAGGGGQRAKAAGKRKRKAPAAKGRRRRGRGAAESEDEEEEEDDEEEEGDEEEEEEEDEEDLDDADVPGTGLKWMQQLSGGQKSLVALALIFAIQKCDPAPFYLFDEIDAALDAQYRTAVANMVHELSASAQFITTTFRPELLVHADRFYGVTFVNKVSQIQCITREDATEFVEQEQPQ